MKLINALTQEDKEAYAAYIKKALKLDDIDVDKSLASWDKNKRRMYKLLGNEMRVSMPVSLVVSREKKRGEIKKIIGGAELPLYYNLNDIQYTIRYLEPGFVRDFIQYLYDNKYLSRENYSIIRLLFRVSNLLDGNIEYGVTDRNLIFEGIKINKGARTIKTIGKIVRKVGFNEKIFDVWRNKISDVTTTKHIKNKLVLSIHPLDFLSLSDNNKGWDSCYSLLQRNMHHEATITHMNSNCVIVAYLESTKPFEVAGYKIPNKSYRQMFYIHKDIICGGRAYPYESVELTKKIIDILKEMVYNKFNWKYQYPIQEYYDDFIYGCNSDIAPVHYQYYHFDRREKSNHHIHLYLGEDSGYNDFVSHRDETFYCVRNYVPKSLFINVTGPQTCIKCGSRIEHSRSYNKKHLLCKTCADEKLSKCCDEPNKTTKPVIILKKISSFSPSFCYKEMCNECLEKYVLIPELGLYVSFLCFNKNFLSKIKMKKIHIAVKDSVWIQNILEEVEYERRGGWFEISNPFYAE